MATQKPQKTAIVRWTSLRGTISILLFLLLASLIEYAIVFYAESLGAIENPEDRIFGVISPLFHLIPAAVVITLTFSWTYLTRCMATKPQELAKRKFVAVVKRGKENKTSVLSRLGARLKIKGSAHIQQKIMKVAIKSALTVSLLFIIFAFTVSLLAYPRLIYEAVTSAYQNNPGLLGFVKGTTETLAPIFWLFSAIGNAIISLAPTFRDCVLALGTIISPLVGLDAVGKYLAFQNIAAWISALSALIYGEYLRKGRRYKIRRKS
ncbi:MAG: hypothetical protein ACP5IM_02200 [Candidatus Bathyarchaeia archaeon]